MSNELLLQNTTNKYTIFPITYTDVWELYLKHKSAIWFTNEVDLSHDLNDWNKLNDKERYFIKHILAFFAASDGIVMENLAARFCSEIQMAEARAFYAMQMFIENEHSIMYSQLIEMYIQSPEEKEKLFNAVAHFPAIRKKAEWAEKWINSDASLATRLVAFAAVEGIFFSGSFCCIYWLRERGVMPGLCLSNDFIARDEGIHCEHACLLYRKYIQNKLSESDIHEIIREAVFVEKEFILSSLPCSLLGMNSAMMSDYIEFVANRLLIQLGYSERYSGVLQPFGFMDRICYDNMSNFFETRVSEYQKSVAPSETQDNLDELQETLNF